MPSTRAGATATLNCLRRCCFQTDVGFLYTELDPALTGIAGASLWCPAGEPMRHLSDEGPRIVVALPRRQLQPRHGTRRLPAMDPAALVRLSTPPTVVGALPLRIRRAATTFVERNLDILLGHWGRRVDSWSLMQGVKRV